ncbi:MAG: hypothetical protein HY985_06335 [Magnetospirillum sp.]|nr:hypothetical protein [Magnetospirillum sp.]
MAAWYDLSARLKGATGADPALDQAVADAFAAAPAAFSASVEACRGLVATSLPGWKMHTGFNVTGIFPYAALTRGDDHLEAEAATLPLAMLLVAVAACLRDEAAAPAPLVPPGA